MDNVLNQSMNSYAKFGALIRYLQNKNLKGLEET